MPPWTYVGGRSGRDNARDPDQERGGAAPTARPVAQGAIPPMSEQEPSPTDVLVIAYAARSDKNTENDQTGQQIAAVRTRVAREGERQIVGVYEEDDRSGYKGDRGPEL